MLLGVTNVHHMGPGWVPAVSGHPEPSQRVAPSWQGSPRALEDLITQEKGVLSLVFKTHVVCVMAHVSAELFLSVACWSS